MIQLSVKTLLIDMNDTYPPEMTDMIKGISGEEAVWRISMKDIQGKDMYCDHEAYREISLRLRREEGFPRGIHFIDTGNYHYLTRVFTSNINEKYELILIDHHTDMQSSAFGDILSCGSWALDAFEKDDNLARLSVYGPPVMEGGREAEVILNEKKISGMVFEKSACLGDIPLYLSIDTDILSADEYVTNWDQGNLSLYELEGLIKKVTDGRLIFGADICGGISRSDPGWNEDIMDSNAKADLSIYKVIADLMKRQICRYIK